jgi:alkylation response protein AidB-like acyl-CoA dehydrogenase
MTYKAPVDDILAALKATGALDRGMMNASPDGLDEATVRAILEEAGKFGADVLDPLNRVGDRTGSRLDNGRVVTPPGWAEAYRQFVDGGWGALPGPVEHGGQGLPSIVAMAVCEIWNSANMAFGMCSLLTNGAIDALHIGGSEELKARYLPRMISGEWTGTMNLTEPQAGSDLNAIATRAVPAGDGTYRITGTKIYISYGEHDLTENIIHLVLARLPDAPAGTRGISLFLVPKWLLAGDGTRGARNDVVCAGLEHKMGIVASPTCVMTFGEQGGATGYLVGEPNRGLQTMFVMMNMARLSVGMQGVAIAERATQRAVAYARERRQGRAVGATDTAMAPIIVHPDVRRMLLTMQALTRAARGICLATAAATDLSHHAPDAATREQAAARVALLTPVAKAFATDAAVDVASLGIQVHGGMGYIEETGAAQYLRDARILPIYEGTNGIQAIDLVMRKLPLADGEVLMAYLAEVDATLRALRAADVAGLEFGLEQMQGALAALTSASEWMGRQLPGNPEIVLAGATPYLKLFGLVAGGDALARAALGAGNDAAPVALLRFYAENLSVGAWGHAFAVMGGAGSVLEGEIGVPA